MFSMIISNLINTLHIDVWDTNSHYSKLQFISVLLHYKNSRRRDRVLLRFYSEN
jgi:hypothetical protein